MNLNKANKTNTPEVEHKGKPAWHTEYPGGMYALLKSKESGLTEGEAKERLEKEGKNQIAESKQSGIISRFFGQLKSPLTLVLVGAFLVTLSLQEFVDATVIAFALMIAVIVGMLQEGRASNAFNKLTSSQQHIAHVRRDGKRFQIDSTELVKGDIVFLQAGMQVPADVRLLKTKDLSVNEAPLTGEWLAVKKQVDVIDIGTPLAERSNMAWMGTLVATGSGIGIVVATGSDTAIGELAEGLRDVKGGETPLQREMERVSRYMLYLIVALIAFIFAVGLLNGQTLHDMLLMSIAIAVASVPEGLPAALTIILAVGMESLLKRGGLVRNLLAAETLGSTTFVLTDKTGTLTEGKMSVAGTIIGGVFFQKVKLQEAPYTDKLFRIATVAADAFYDEKASVVRGDPVEATIVDTAIELEIIKQDSEMAGSKLDYLPFTSDKRFAAGLVESDGVYQLCVNGAPSTLLDGATHYIDKDGNEQQLTDTVKEELLAAIEEETKQGKRLVAVAQKEVLYTDIPDDGSGVLGKLIFAGIIVFADPAREGVSEAIAGVEKAGARILLVTGDNPETALSIAKAVGITMQNPRALTGDEISQYSDEELLSAIDSGISVFARVLPQQKMRITQLLQKRGEVVAMTGDGINDAPALQKANIGIAIGSGTEVAKEASDLVLLNDSFEIIYAAIEEGRRIVNNLKKVVGYLLSTSLSEVVLIGAALLTGSPAPLTASQILWANVIEEGFMSVAFAFEKGDKDLMKQRPEDVHKNGILSKSMLIFIAYTLTILSGLSLALYFYVRSLGLPFEEIRSIMFISISIDSLFMAFAFRSLNQPIWKIPLRTNMFFLGSFLISASMLAVVVSVPFFHEFFAYQPLNLFDITLVAAVSFASLITIEVGKVLFFRPKK